MWYWYGKEVHKKPAPKGPAFYIYSNLSLNVWHKSHEASTLDRTSKIALSFCCHTSTTAIEHTSVWIHIALEAQHVFVINVVCWLVFSFCSFHVLFVSLSQSKFDFRPGNCWLARHREKMTRVGHTKSSKCYFTKR